ncbi:MAG: hypothetical protein ACFB0F_05895 [Neomegalonema sp.]
MEKQLYSYKIDEKIETSFETALSRFEDETFPSVRRVCSAKEIDQSDVPAVVAYLSCAMLRTPVWRDAVIEIYRSGVEETGRLLDAAGEFPTMDAPESDLHGKSFTELIESGTINIEIDNSVFWKQFRRRSKVSAAFWLPSSIACASLSQAV